MSKHEAAARKLTPELRSEAVVESWETMEGETLRDPHRHTFERLIALEIAEAVRVEREVAAKALCDLCHEGKYPVRPGKYRPNEWWHDVGEAQLPCKAAEIRARSEAQATPSPEEQLATWAEGQMEKAKRWYEKLKGTSETKERG